MADKFGWQESYTPVIRWYYENRDQDLDGDMAELDLWARKYMKQVNFNLCSYFEWWGWQLTDETKTVCSELPALEEDLLADYFHPTEHGTCPEGWYAYGQKCFFKSEEKLNWWEAEEKCVQGANGAHLASCFTEKESYFLASLVQDKTDYYVGFSDLAEHEKFVFLDGSEPTGSLPWEANEPDKGNEQHCAVFYNKELWDDYCNKKYHFICQTGPGTCAPSHADACLDGWIYWNGGCYFFEDTAKKAWQDADTDCKSKNEQSKLVQINSEGEQLFLDHYLTDRRKTGTLNYYWRRFWIGLEDSKGEEWADGEALAYKSWCEGEPNGANYPAYMWNYKGFCWDDTRATNEFGYICEMPANANAV